jgi:hypothetical protein
VHCVGGDEQVDNECRRVISYQVNDKFRVIVSYRRAHPVGGDEQVRGAGAAVHAA